jgi:hypothetical protein
MCTPRGRDQSHALAVHLADARTVEELAVERHRKYQSDRGRTESLNSWAPKISRSLLEAMGAWELLNHPAASTSPPVTSHAFLD